VTCGAEYAAGAEFRLASYQCHVRRAHVRSPNAGAWHWDPLRFDLAGISTAGAQARGALDLGELLEMAGISPSSGTISCAKARASLASGCLPIDSSVS
jgi:hypothetical protein